MPNRQLSLQEQARLQNEKENKLAELLAAGDMRALDMMGINRPSEPKSVSQETFDAAVEENMEMFEMSKDEAIKEALDQFKAQGVDVSQIKLT